MIKIKMTEFKLKNLNSTTTFRWHPRLILEDIPARQVYGFIYLRNKKVVVVKDSDEERFSLPGGGIEEGEKPLQAMIRELQEEAQLKANKITLLGSLEVLTRDRNNQIIEHVQQVRYICEVKSISKFIPNKDGFETDVRLEINVNELPNYIEWIKYPSGQIQYEQFLEYLK